MTQNTLWLIKYPNGKIQGPFADDKILKLIEEEVIEGDEQLSTYPGGKWKPISTQPEFYDSLLKVLNQEEENIPPEPISLDPKTSKTTTPLSQSESTATVVADIGTLKAFKAEKKRKDKLRSQRKNTTRLAAETVIYQLEEDDYDDNPEHPEHKSTKNLKKAPALKKRKYLILAGLGGLALLFFLSGEDSSHNQDYLTLKKPAANQPALPPAEVSILIKKGFLQYLKGTSSSYLKAQSLLVSAVQGSPSNTYAMALLCLVYLELYPFSQQGINTSNIIQSLVHKTSILNKGGVRSGLCHSVGLMIKGKYQPAKTMVESSLDGLSGSLEDTESQKLLPFFYYLKAKALFYLNDYPAVTSYLDTIQKILPQWITPYMLSAEMLLKKGQVSQALSIYNKVLSLNPKNKTAKIKTGLIEYRQFNKIQKAETILTLALAWPERVLPHILSSAYFALAEIHLKNRQTSPALKYARLAYSYNPANKASRNLIVQLGGLKKLKETKVVSTQLIYEGDQLMLNNKFQSAIGYYEEAFKADGDQNAMAAVKAAKAYWVLSFSDQALSWLKKAINVNSKFMEAYVLMAEYYAKLYDFHNADKILKTAFKISPKSYELHRGRAYLSLKQGDYNGAIRSAKRAIKIYEADMESYVIISEAYAKLGNTNEALAFATRALEVDPNSAKTQIAYARALGSVYSVDTGMAYFKKLIENYPLVMEYRMESMKYLFEDDQYQRARQEAHNIIEIEPKYNTAYFYLGRILMVEEDFKSAYEAFLQSAILNPSDPRPTFYIGLLRLKERRHDEAKKQLQKVLALNPLYPKAHYYLGRLSFLKGDYEEAIKEARLENRSNPRLILPYLLAGESYEKLGQFLNCSQEYQKAVELAPENMNFYVRTARCYRKSGRLDLARKILKKASGESSNVRSGDPHLYKELGIIYEVKGNLRSATNSYCTYLNLTPRAPDRPDIEARMRKLAKLTGETIKQCG